MAIRMLPAKVTAMLKTAFFFKRPLNRKQKPRATQIDSVQTVSYTHLPGEKIEPQKADSPTLTMNNIGRHISKMAYLKVVSNKSPWLREAELGGIYVNPLSHGEGRFVASDEWINTLYANGQVATQYVEPAGNPTMDEEWNPNGSYMAIAVSYTHLDVYKSQADYLWNDGN